MKNKGFSLVEIIVVVAILAVTLTLLFLSVNTIFALNVQKTAKEIVSELGKTKIACMTRQGDVSMRLYKTDEGIMLEHVENGTPKGPAEKVGKADIVITCYFGSDTDGTELDASGLTFSFNRSDGSFKPTSGGSCTKLVVSSKDNSRTILLWPETGKVTYNG